MSDTDQVERFIAPLFTWRSLIADKNGPKNPTTRHVLLTLSLHMNERGESCFPSTRMLEEETGLSRRTVETHLATAVADGWLVRSIKGVNGQGWKRYEYSPATPPERGATDSPPLQKDAETTENNNTNHALAELSTDDNKGGATDSPPYIEGGDRVSPPLEERGETDAQRGETDDINVAKEDRLSTSLSTSNNTTTGCGVVLPVDKFKNLEYVPTAIGEWQEYFINVIGYAPNEVIKTGTIPAFRKWVEAKVSVMELDDQIAIYRARNGDELPNSPAYFDKPLFGTRRTVDALKPSKHSIASKPKNKPWYMTQTGTIERALELNLHKWTDDCDETFQVYQNLVWQEHYKATGEQIRRNSKTLMPYLAKEQDAPAMAYSDNKQAAAGG